VAGGFGGAARGPFSAVGGGQSNVATGTGATIPGGQAAVAPLHGQLAHAAGSFDDDGDAQTSVYVLRRETTDDADEQPLFLDGSGQRLLVGLNRSLAFDALVVGRAANGLSSAYSMRGLAKNIGGAITVVMPVGSPQILHEDVPAWDADVSNSTDGSIDFFVTGQAGVTIRWVATVRTVEVQH
jgi:hypothetical protein